MAGGHGAGVHAVLQVVGAALIVAGVVFWSPAAALVVGGVLVLGIGVSLEGDR